MTGNDRELLERAAKAAGFTDIDFLADDGYANVYDNDGKQSAWNPLQDDGDALRLAVKLGVQVIPGTYNEAEFSAFKAGSCEVHEALQDHQDKFAATRRAIVRAAAEIGKKTDN